MGITSAPTTGQPRRRRRWLQFGLGTLLGLVTLTAVSLCAIVNRAERQRRAVAAVQHLGGDVAFADEGDGILWWTPEWLRGWVRDGYFQPVTMVSLMSVTEVSDADLSHLKGLTGLQRLWLQDTKVSDAGLKHLKGMSSLQRLWLLNTQVSEVGVAELRAAMPNCNIEASMPTVTAP